jgi:RNA polymerase sigma-70 factor (ECF subfamily)
MGVNATVQTDEMLVRSAQSGDAHALEALVERYFGMVYAIAYARLNSREMAEDLAQEVFLRVHLHLGRLDDPRRFSAWLSSMARNLAIDWLRRGQRASRLLPLVPLEEAFNVAEHRQSDAREHLQGQDDHRVVHEAIFRLPAEQRELVMLRYVEELDVDEIAGRLGVHKTTVRRHLKQALGALRGSLEPMLGDLAPTLRARPAVAARTTAVVVAAVALSAAQKSALASAAATGLEVATAKITFSAGAGVFTALTGFLKSFSALTGAGGASMGLGKGIAITVAAVVVVGGGAAYYVQQQQSSSPGGGGAGAPAVAGAQNQTETLPPLKKWGSWIEMARAWAAEHPENKGIGPFIDTQERLDTMSVAAAKQAVDAIVRDGWNAPYTKVADLLRSQRPALDVAYAAAAAAPFSLPPTEDVTSPAPNFLALQQLCKLMLADARWVESQGDLDTALDKAVLSVRLFSCMSAEEQSLISHLISVANQMHSLKTVQALLANPRTSVEAAQRTGVALHELAAKRVGMIAGLRWESQCGIKTAKRMMTDPAYVASMGPEGEALKKQIGNFEAYKTEKERVWGVTLANLEKPYWQREEMGEQWGKSISKHPLVQVGLPNFQEAMIRDEVALAHLQIAQALCALKMQRNELLAQFTDPFTGEPLRMTNDGLYSLGPDRTDQSGMTPYDPTNGVKSAGDIFARR